MLASFEQEKNLKASAITLAVCLLLFLAFYFLKWTLPQIPMPTIGEGIEVNLGNSETGLGDIAPQSTGNPTVAEDPITSPPPSVKPVTTTQIITAD